MLYLQPIATRFGTELLSEINSGKWTKLCVAVAWVRSSGMAHIRDALKAFVSNGNSLDVVVGVDLDNTSAEGLQELLNIAQNGQVNLVVHHNESGPVFHPKIYLFLNGESARLIVGSNNITEAGLFRNTEVALSLDAHPQSEQIKAMLDAFAVWTDPASGLAKKLDAGFLAALVANGYVKSEATIRARIAAQKPSVTPGAKKLFKSTSVSAPLVIKASPPKGSKVTKPAAKPGKLPAAIAVATLSTQGQVLLMRVRKARGTQVQVPIRVMREPFFAGVTQVTSVQTGQTRGIHPAGGGTASPNTLKLELPETAAMPDPVVRFERTATGIQYEAYDSASPQGRAIMSALKHGQSMVPVTTFLTTPGTPASATWWRFV